MLTERRAEVFNSTIASRQLPKELWRPPLHFEPARQHTLLTAASLDATLHHVPNLDQARADLGFASPTAFVSQRHLAYRQTRSGRHLQKVVARAIRIRQLGFILRKLIVS